MKEQTGLQVKVVEALIVLNNLKIKRYRMYSGYLKRFKERILYTLYHLT